jgi:hypothetical protein
MRKTQRQKAQSHFAQKADEASHAEEQRGQPVNNGEKPTDTPTDTQKAQQKPTAKKTQPHTKQAQKHTQTHTKQKQTQTAQTKPKNPQPTQPTRKTTNKTTQDNQHNQRTTKSLRGVTVVEVEWMLVQVWFASLGHAQDAEAEGGKVQSIVHPLLVNGGMSPSCPLLPVAEFTVQHQYRHSSSSELIDAPNGGMNSKR